MVKQIHIHLGPHKTGSTAIQHYLAAHADDLAEHHGLTVIPSPLPSDLAFAMINGDPDATSAALAAFAKAVADAPGDCVVSCEDFSGDLPGRSQRARIYPGLWQSIKKLMQAVPEAHCRFYFFLREPESWLRSAYAQHVQHRSRFNSFEKFCDYFQTSALWDGVLKRARNRLQDDLLEIEYLTDPGFSSIDAFLKVVLGPKAEYPERKLARRWNTSMDADGIRIFETINMSGASEEAQKAAKKSVSDAHSNRRDPVEPDTLAFPTWPPRTPRPDWMSESLSALWGRASARVSHQDQPILLPDPFADLTEYRQRAVTASDTFPQGGRAHMQNQVDILSYRFRGAPETCVLLGLSISYLRRGTEHTEHAAYMFQRLWAEEYEILLGALPTRWLISSFQTFMDHGANEAQRIIGSAAFFMTNTLKMYEAERALEGTKADAVYPGTSPKTPSGFKGLDRFQLGGTDLMLNTSALLLELSARDDVAGRVVHEFLLRLKSAHSVFSRMDRSRQHHGADVPQFTNCWSFFEEPE